MGDESGIRKKNHSAEPHSYTAIPHMHPQATPSLPPTNQPPPKEECSASVKLTTERLNKHDLNKLTVNTEQQHDMQHVAKLARH